MMAAKVSVPSYTTATTAMTTTMKKLEKEGCYKRANPLNDLILKKFLRPQLFVLSSVDVGVFSSSRYMLGFARNELCQSPSENESFWSLLSFSCVNITRHFMMTTTFSPW